jgi:hypothetical protein
MQTREASGRGVLDRPLQRAHVKQLVRLRPVRYSRIFTQRSVSDGMLRAGRLDENEPNNPVNRNSAIGACIPGLSMPID